ncbi:K(+)-transporting ATPase subunit C [Verrucomicrobium sp. BvORR106]|uniref:K(+)-transporting ATPase subunit C n=1 Tax=Verrucomicrobium sp. BvORR106 TaxID=1403819 RepID=UPI000570E8AE|nr:K(+)-transporting ATPase subunit C [Verrucomicrobium sp. BvORR106]
MKQLIHDLRGAVVSTLVFTVVLCGAYPLVVWAVAQTAFPDKANGSLIKDADGTVRGSTLLGQNFTGEAWFQPRPSAAGAFGYDAASSSGSNLGPTSQKLADAIKERVAAYRTANGLAETESVPADAVTASGSGLDPHISLRNAELQAGRVARARNLTVEQVRVLIARCTQKPDAGLLGDAGVNVLQLNLELERMPHSATSSTGTP